MAIVFSPRIDRMLGGLEWVESALFISQDVPLSLHGFISVLWDSFSFRQYQKSIGKCVRVLSEHILIEPSTENIQLGFCLRPFLEREAGPFVPFITLKRIM